MTIAADTDNHTAMNTPVTQVTRAFSHGHPAFMPYFTLGYPDYQTSLDIIRVCAGAGADLMELGMPFSDPLADGPTIQHSTQVALENGMTTERCLQAVRDLRTQGVRIPLMLMGYYNPILTHGEAPFARAAAAAGANGIIIPDLPPEEATNLEDSCRQHGLALSYLLAPTSTEARIRLVAQKATGFVYLVSLTGVTGARAKLPSTLRNFVARARRHVSLPLAVGFGISSVAHAQQVGQLADGVIVGSKLISVAQRADDPVDACEAFVREMVEALKDTNTDLTAAQSDCPA